MPEFSKNIVFFYFAVKEDFVVIKNVVFMWIKVYPISELARSS